MGKLREVKCGRCGSRVRIPWFWALGLEGVFYCRECRKYFRTDYRLGAVLTGAGWALALGTVQLIGYFTSAFTVILAAVLFLPAAFFYAFLLRKFFLTLTCARRPGNRKSPSKKENQPEDDSAGSSE